MEEGRIVQVKPEVYVLLGESFVLEVRGSQIVSILRGPTEPETEDIPHVTLTLDTPHRGVQASAFSYGAKVKWQMTMSNAQIEIKGVVLSSNSSLTTLSEWGCSAVQREWVVPTHLLSWCPPLEE
jgi:hypothetical protein